MKREAGWLASGGLLVVLVGCNTFDRPGSGEDPFGAGVPPNGGGFLPGGGFGTTPNPPVIFAGSAAFGAAGQPMPVAGNGARPPGGWQPIDAGPSEADGGSDDAGS